MDKKENGKRGVGETERANRQKERKKAITKGKIKEQY